MKKFLYTFLVITIFSSCSPFQKALKSEDVGEKFKLGEQLYNEGKYSKANRLFKQIAPSYRGKPQGEKLIYLFSDTYLKMDQYFLAGHHFDKFVSLYPSSEKKEEAMFLAAKCVYLISPVYSKDQTDTQQAIDKLQQFVNAYPESQFLPEANSLVKELDFKLEKKAFETAKQYNRISDYKASLKSLDAFIFNFPGSSLREEVSYLKFDSAYKLAVNSIKVKKKERLDTADSYYSSFNKKYPNSEFAEQAKKMKEDLDKQLEQFSTKSDI